MLRLRILKISPHLPMGGLAPHVAQLQGRLAQRLMVTLDIIYTLVVPL